MVSRAALVDLKPPSLSYDGNILRAQGLRRRGGCLGHLVRRFAARL